MGLRDGVAVVAGADALVGGLVWAFGRGGVIAVDAEYDAVGQVGDWLQSGRGAQGWGGVVVAAVVADVEPYDVRPLGCAGYPCRKLLAASGSGRVAWIGVDEAGGDAGGQEIVGCIGGVVVVEHR